ncbi:MAG TPA: hypothetical protein VNN73_21420 [Blastocatellia bacterium]|nr:hypothetical protein [Blastocatellia bacterium]
MSKQDLHFDPDPVIEAYKKDVDRALIRENLRLSVEERFERLIKLQRFAEELRRAGQQAGPKR